MKLVFDVKINTVINASELEITLTNPYKYSGKNLLVSVYKSAAGTGNMGVLFYYIPMDKTYTLNNPGWNVAPDPNAAFPPYSDRQDLPSMKLLFKNNVTDGVEEVIMDNVQIYPNPFADYLIIKTDKQLPLNIFNIEGRCLLTTTLNAGSNKIDVHLLQKGTYLVKCGNRVLKLVK